jgi:hypothetical protein
MHTKNFYKCTPKTYEKYARIFQIFNGNSAQSEHKPEPNKHNSCLHACGYQKKMKLQIITFHKQIRARSDRNQIR